MGIRGRSKWGLGKKSGRVDKTSNGGGIRLVRRRIVFKAEEGIGDAQESRGLGEGCKRQG